MSRVLPIIFKTEMVRAILNGRKTATRRIVKIPYELEIVKIVGESGNINNPLGAMYLGGIKRPPYQPGDILYVRETWGISNIDCDDKTAYIVYKASENERDEGCKAIRLPDDKFEKLYDSMAENSLDWRPSIHMPKEAARIWLKATDVRVERLHDMKLDDFLSEGVVIRPEAFNDPENAYMQARKEFARIWDSTIKKSQTVLNPWVWVIEFERYKRPEGELCKEGN